MRLSVRMRRGRLLLAGTALLVGAGVLVAQNALVALASANGASGRPASVRLASATRSATGPSRSTSLTAAATAKRTGGTPSGMVGRARNAACRGTGVLFCEDFNALPIGAATSPNWTVDTQQGTLTVEAFRHGSRNRVLRAHTVGNGRALLTITGFHAPHNSYYGRMWVKVAAFPVAPDFAHFVLVQATGTGSPETVRPVGGQFINTKFLKNGGPARSLWGIGTDGGPTGDWTNWKETATARPGTWQCIEWTMQARDNRVQLRVNGVANPDLVVTTNDHGGKAVPFTLPTVNKLQIGWWLFQPGPTPTAFDVRYDNIVLSTARPGCGRPPTAH